MMKVKKIIRDRIGSGKAANGVFRNKWPSLRLPHPYYYWFIGSSTGSLGNKVVRELLL